MVYCKVDTATHLRQQLPLLNDNAAAACWVQVFVLIRSGPLLRNSRLAPTITRKFESCMVNRGEVPGTICPILSPHLNLKGGDSM
jgi:hypothetical protein